MEYLINSFSGDEDREFKHISKVIIAFFAYLDLLKNCFWASGMMSHGIGVCYIYKLIISIVKWGWISIVNDVVLL